MKKIVFLVIVFFLANFLSIKAQEIVNEVEVDCRILKDARFAFEGIELLQSNEGIRVTTTIQSHAMPAVAGAISNQMAYFPGFIFYELDENLGGLKVVREMINLNSYKFNGEKKAYTLQEQSKTIGSSEKDKEYKVLAKEYPKFLLTEKDAGKKTTYKLQANIKNEFSLQKNTSPVEFNIYANTLLKGESVFNEKKVEYPESDMKRIVMEGYLKDEQNGYFVDFVGMSYSKQEIKEDKAKKFNYLQDYEFYVIDKEAGIKGHFHKKFNYPKNLLYKALMKENNGTVKGYQYIFGHASGVGKKYNDPEKDNNEYICFSPEGKEIFSSKFKLRKGAGFIYAFNRKDEVVLFVKGTEYKFGIITLSKSGGKENSIEWSDLTEKTVGDKSLSLKNSFNPGITIQGHLFLDDQSFVLYGEKVDEVGPVGGDKTNSYNYIALHFDKDGTLISQYTSKKLDDVSKLISSELNCVYSDQNKIYFVTREVLDDVSSKPYSQFFIGKNLQPIVKDSRKYISTPVILKLDLSSKKISNKKVSVKNFSVANDNSYYTFNKEKMMLYFAGYEQSSEILPLKMLISKIQL